MARPKGSKNITEDHETTALNEAEFDLSDKAHEMLMELPKPHIKAKHMQFYGQTELPGTLGIQKTLNQSKFPGIKIIWTPTAILVEHKDNLGLMGVAGMASFTPA